MQRAFALAVVIALAACDNGPTDPRTTVIADGTWTGDNACLLVRSAANVSPHISELHVGCGHGVFPTPEVRADGTFDVDGTWRIEAGPISIDPAPPAHFSGTLTNSTLTLTVRPSSGSAATYRLQMNPGGSCGPACL